MSSYNTAYPTYIYHLAEGTKGNSIITLIDAPLLTADIINKYKQFNDNLNGSYDALKITDPTNILGEFESIIRTGALDFGKHFDVKSVEPLPLSIAEEISALGQDSSPVTTLKDHQGWIKRIKATEI